MNEFLVVIDHPINEGLIEEYIRSSEKYFRKFDISYTTSTILRNDVAFIEFTKDDVNKFTIQEINSNSFFSSIGTWFFRERCNDTQNSLTILFERLLGNIEEALSDVEGAFSFILYDGNKNTLKVVTDRIGVSPVYTRQIGSRQLISSSCLLLASLEPVELDPVGLKEFLLANKLFNNTTLFKDIKKLNPASILEYNSSGKKITEYWSIHFGQSKIGLSTNEKVEILAVELREIMARLGQLFNLPFVDLTGGWDSRAVIITGLDSFPNLAAVTSGSASDKDVVIAKRIAEELGIKHYLNRPFITSDSFSLEKYSQYLKRSLYLTDGSMSAPLYVNTLASHSTSMANGADITLNGSGGELLRSYWWEPARLYNSEIKKLQFTIPNLTTYYNKRELVRRVIHQDSDLTIFDPDFDTDIYTHLIRLFDQTNKPFMPISNTDQIHNVYLFHRMQNWLAGYSKATSRMLACLSPLLMSRPLETLAQIRPHEKAFCNLLRKFHKYVNPKIAKIETGYGYPAEPLSLLNCTQFLPAIKKKSTDMSTKLAIKAGLKTATTNNSQNEKNLGRIREVLHLQPERMKLIDIFNKSNLNTFLNDSEKDSFQYSQFYENIYTVESILGIISSG